MIMPDPKKPEELNELAGGWITERKNTQIPTFLKFAYIFIAGGCFAYFLFFMNGDVNHSTRGNLVRQMNQSTPSSSSNGFMYIVAVLILIFAITAIVFAFKKTHED
jgi:hypothetical protein